MAESDSVAAGKQFHGADETAFVSCSVRIDAVTIERAVESLLDGAVTGAVHLCNAYTLSLAAGDESLSNVLNRGSLNLPDGKPLVWIARALGIRHLSRRVYGPELMERTLAAGQPRGTRHFLYGSTPDVIAALSDAVARRWPDASLVGSEAPPFGELSDDELDRATQRFRDVGAQLVWVGLGTPKQDLVAARLSERSDLTFVAIGAAFDFIGGSKKQAPRVMREHGLEWLYRLLSEPRRLWKRYLVGNSVFVYQNLRHRPRLSGTTVDE